MANRTLYEAVAPLLTLLKPFGLNWSKDSGVGKKKYLKFLLIFIWVTYYTISDYMSLKRETSAELVINSSSLFGFTFCLAKWKTLNNFLHLLKSCHISKKTWKSMEMMRKILSTLPYAYLAFSLLFVLAALMMLGQLLQDQSLTFMLKLGLCALVLPFFLAMSVTVVIPLCGTNILHLVTTLICCSAHYVNVAIKESLEDLKKSKSPLRRAKMTTKTIGLYHQLNGLTRVTNQIGAPLIFALKASVLVFSILIHSWLYGIIYENNFQILIFYLVLPVVSLPYIMVYLFCISLISPVNQLPAVIAKTFIDSVLLDDRVTLTNSISELCLLKIHLDQLVQLAHLTLVHNSFTMLDEPLDDAHLFLFFTDLMDNLNSVFSVN